MKIVTIEYNGITAQYAISEYFCPHCGKQAVWEEQDEGDYYCGVDYACIACGSIFCIPILRYESKDTYDVQLIEALRQKIEHQIKESVE